MSETTVKRYKHKSQRIGYEVDGVTTSRMGGMYEDPDGDYVLASDYDALEAKYLEISQKHGALMFKAAGFPPVEGETALTALHAERKLVRDVVEAAETWRMARAAESGQAIAELGLCRALDAWKGSKETDDE